MQCGVWHQQCIGVWMVVVRCEPHYGFFLQRAHLCGGDDALAGYAYHLDIKMFQKRLEQQGNVPG